MEAVLYLDDGVEMIITQHSEMLAVRSALQVSLQQFPVEAQPRGAYQPRHGSAASVVSQRRRLCACHDKRRELNPAGTHSVHLGISELHILFTRNVLCQAEMRWSLNVK